MSTLGCVAFRIFCFKSGVRSDRRYTKKLVYSLYSGTRQVSSTPYKTLIINCVYCTIVYNITLAIEMKSHNN